MSDIVLFHHAQGLTAGVHAIAERFRAAGHRVLTPDVYGGATFDDLESGIAHARAIGFDRLLADAVEAAQAFPAESVYVGLSLGVMPAQQLAQTRAGARGAILVGSAVPADEFGTGWPAGVPLQIHGMDADPVFAGEGDLEAAQGLVETAGAELHVYPGGTHLFVDASLADHDPAAAELALTRMLDLLDHA